MSYGLKEFSKDKLNEYEKKYDSILENAKIENENISSTYYKDKANTLLNRLIKYKHNHLLFINDFVIKFDNNSMERDLRMLKIKTKVSGGFRSINGAKNYADAMSIIKTSIKRSINPFNSIMNIFKNQVLFN